MKEWIVVACRAEAKIFERDNKDQALRWVKTLSNKKGRRKERDFDSDGPGVSFGKYSANCSPHNLEAKHSHADVIAKKFALKISNLLKSAFAEGRYKKATIFAAPRFLGKLRHEIEAHMKSVTKVENIFFVGTNLEKSSSSEIMAHMRAS